MSNKIDESKENIRRIKETLDNTKENYEFTNKVMQNAADEDIKSELKMENARRSEEIDKLQGTLEEHVLLKKNKNNYEK